MEGLVKFISKNKRLLKIFYNHFYHKLLEDYYLSVDNFVGNYLKKKDVYLHNEKVNGNIKELLKLKNIEIRSLSEDEVITVLKSNNLIKQLQDNSIHGEDLSDDDERALIYWLCIVLKDKRNFILFLRNLFNEGRADIESFYSEGRYKGSQENDETNEDYKIRLKFGFLYFYEKVDFRVIRSVSEYLDYLEKDLPLTETVKFFYRGHGDINYMLEPSIERTTNEKKERKWMEKEHLIFEEILVRNPEDFKNSPLNIDKLRSMQHYGVPTRLLDLTSNPLIALYFAVSTSPTNHAEVVVLNVEAEKIKYNDSDSVTILSALARLPYKDKEKLFKAAVELDSADKKMLSLTNEYTRLISIIKKDKPNFENTVKKETLREVQFVLTPKDNRRIQKQDGAFICCTVNPYVMYNINNYRFEKHDKRIILLIHKKYKNSILKELEKIDIHKGTVYPEIEKVAEYIKEKYK